MKRYRMSVCKGADCRANGSDAVFARARELVGSAGLAGRCDLFRGGCYGLCHLGPNVVIREHSGEPLDPFSSEDFQLTYEPSEAYYWKMTPEKIARVLSEHVKGDRPVDELLGDPTLEEDFRKRE